MVFFGFFFFSFVFFLFLFFSFWNITALNININTGKPRTQRKIFTQKPSQFVDAELKYEEENKNQYKKANFGRKKRFLGAFSPAKIGFFYVFLTRKWKNRGGFGGDKLDPNFPGISRFLGGIEGIPLISPPSLFSPPHSQEFLRFPLPAFAFFPLLFRFSRTHFSTLIPFSPINSIFPHSFLLTHPIPVQLFPFFPGFSHFFRTHPHFSTLFFVSFYFSHFIFIFPPSFFPFTPISPRYFHFSTHFSTLIPFFHVISHFPTLIPPHPLNFCTLFPFPRTHFFTFI